MPEFGQRIKNVYRVRAVAKALVVRNRSALLSHIETAALRGLYECQVSFTFHGTTPGALKEVIRDLLMGSGIAIDFARDTQKDPVVFFGPEGYRPKEDLASFRLYGWGDCE